MNYSEFDEPFTEFDERFIEWLAISSNSVKCFNFGERFIEKFDELAQMAEAFHQNEAEKFGNFGGNAPDRILRIRAERETLYPIFICKGRLKKKIVSKIRTASV